MCSVPLLKLPNNMYAIFLILWNFATSSCLGLTTPDLFGYRSFRLRSEFAHRHGHELTIITAQGWVRAPRVALVWSCGAKDRPDSYVSGSKALSPKLRWHRAAVLARRCSEADGPDRP